MLLSGPHPASVPPRGELSWELCYSGRRLVVLHSLIWSTPGKPAVLGTYSGESFFPAPLAKKRERVGGGDPPSPRVSRPLSKGDILPKAITSEFWEVVRLGLGLVRSS